MLIETIADNCLTYFEQNPDHDTILWFDAKREWEGLLPHLQPHLPLLIYEGSLLHLRYRLVERPPGQCYVVYLPFESLQRTRRGMAEYMRPFIYTSKVFDDSIETVLRDQGITLPEGYGKMRDIRPHLPALTVASVGKGRAFWEGLDNLEAILARLFPDFEERLMRLLAFPERTMTALENQDQTSAFFKLLKSEFGAASPDQIVEDKWAALLPFIRKWADRFTATLCLVETFVATGEPADFPFKQALPEPVYWDRCRDFLRKWQRDEMFKDTFAQRARAIDGQYNLAGWVKDLPEPPMTDGSPFLNIERAIWERMRERLDAITDKAEAVDFCHAERGTIRERARGFWAREGALPGWSALVRMTEVIIGAADALDELSRYDCATVEQEALDSGQPSTGSSRPVPLSAAWLIERYAETWWQIDRAYRRFRDEVNRGVGQLDAARKWTQRIYRDFLEEVNTRFGEALMEEGNWPPDDLSLGAGDLWNGAQAKGQGGRALILADALRYELGQDLTQRLQPSPQATTSVVLSPLPSVTALGMAALLPGWSELEVNYAGGKWRITAPGFKGNIAARKHRLAWLEKQLDSVAIFDLDEWLTTPLDDVPRDKDWIVITSTEIDAVGEGAGAVAWHTADALLERLEQAVRRLLALNCAEIHVASDHGFLLRENVRGSDKFTVDAPDERLLKRSERYLLLRGSDLPPTDLPALPVSGSANLIAVFPRGIGCFFTPGAYDFMHGGISLQELVTARVTVRQSVEERPVSVALELVPGAEIRNAIFKMRLIPQGVNLLSRARRVEIDVAHAGERVSRTWEAVVNRDVVEKSLRLSPQMGLDEGDAIAVRVWDADTGELLAQQPAVVQVDLDW